MSTVGNHPRSPPLPGSFPGPGGILQLSRTCRLPTRRPRTESRPGFRIGCRAWTWRGLWPRWNFRCTSTGQHQDAYSISGHGPTGRGCTKSCCRKERPPTSLLTLTVCCSSTCGKTLFCPEPSGLRGSRSSRLQARPRRNGSGRQRAGSVRLSAGGGQAVLRLACQPGIPAGRWSGIARAAPDGAAHRRPRLLHCLRARAGPPRSTRASTPKCSPT